MRVNRAVKPAGSIAESLHLRFAVVEVRLPLVMGAAEDGNVVDRRWTTSAQRLSVVKLEPAALRTTPARTNEGAPAFVAFPHGPSNRGRDVARASCRRTKCARCRVRWRVDCACRGARVRRRLSFSVGGQGSDVAARRATGRLRGELPPLDVSEQQRQGAADDERRIPVRHLRMEQILQFAQRRMRLRVHGHVQVVSRGSERSNGVRGRCLGRRTKPMLIGARVRME